MKTIKIMIAASEEMHEEKLEFSNLIEHLNEVLEPRGIELKRIKWNPETDGSIEEYKAKLKECEMCLTLYWRDLVGNSKEGLDTAYQELKDGNNPRNLYVFFKEPTEDLTEALKDFKANFVTNYGHFFCKFKNVDTMNLHFILQFEAFQNHLRRTDAQLVKVAGGKVMVADKDFVNLDNVPFAAFNKEYQRLQKELLELDIQVAEIRKRHKADPDNEDIEDELMTAKSKRKKLADEFEKYQIHLYDIALNFAMTAGEKYSERMRKARELFELGDVIGADQILNMEEMKKEALHGIKQFEQYRNNLELAVEEFRLKAETVIANSSITISERLSIACDAYEQAIDIGRTINYQKDKLAYLFLDYAFWLDELNRKETAAEYYDNALKIFHLLEDNESDKYVPVTVTILNKLANALTAIDCFHDAETIYINLCKICKEQAGKNPKIYLPSLAMSNTNYANLQCILGQYEEAETNYKESLPIYHQLSKDNPKKYLPEFAKAKACYANLLYNVNRYDEAESLHRSALDICLMIGKEKTEEYIHVIDIVGQEQDNLANLLVKMERYEEAMCFFQRAIDVFLWLAKIIPNKYLPQLANTQSNYATMLGELRQYKKADELYKDALDNYQKMHSANSEAYCPNVVDLLNNYASLKESLGCNEEADVLYKKALEGYRLLMEIDERAYSYKLAASLGNYALFLKSTNHLNDAEKNYRESLELFQHLIESKNSVFIPKMAGVQNGLANLLSYCGNYVEAEEMFKKNLSIYQQLAGKDPHTFNPSLAMTLNNWAVLKIRQNNIDDAKQLFMEALSIYLQLDNKTGKYKERIETITNFINNNLK